ncbi:flagellar motor protein MotB [Candidatus Omnitrophota bacterium]
MLPKNPKSIHRTMFAPANLGESKLEKGWPPAWSISFADLTTLLMAGFILWYALTAMRIPPELLTMKEVSQVIPEDIKMLESFQEAGPGQGAYMLKIKAFTPKQRKVIREMKSLRELKDDLENFIQDAGIDDKVAIEMGEEAILIMPREPLVFPEGDARLKKSSFGLLDKIIEAIINYPHYRIRIEGHTDSTPIGPLRRIKYPSNWELSCARAISVARYMISKGMPPEYFGVAGFAEHKPKFKEKSADVAMKNRRVDIYISLKEAETKK